MYISGHVEIIDDIFRTCYKSKDDYFGKFDNLPNVTYDNLIVGVKIVDLPCQKYRVNHDKRFVYIRKHKICSMFKFLNFFREVEKNSGKLFQFHKGYFGHLHAMTTDPSNTVRKIRSKILTSILGYSLLSVYDFSIFDKSPSFMPNSVWIGYILHVITDSYSPAHTIRDESLGVIAIPLKQKQIDQYKEYRIEVHETIKAIARKKTIFMDKKKFKKTLIDHLNKKKFFSPFANNHPHRAKFYIQTYSRSLWKSYKVFKLEYALKTKVMEMTNIDEIPNLPSKKYDIKNFQYYDSQSFVSHASYDLLSFTKSNKHLYSRMMKDCHDILRYYAEVVKTRDVTRFIKRMKKLVMTRTFRIHKRYLNNKTNLIVK